MLFKQVRSVLPEEVRAVTKQLSFYSEGILNRVLIGFEAAFNQGEINHITGDINFIALFLRKKRTVLTILDVGFMNHPGKLARLFLRLFWIVFPAKRSAVITTISNSAKSEILKFVSVDPSKIVVIYVPISNLFKPVSKVFNKSKPVLLQVGTRSNKNVIRLVKALTGIDCHLDIVGDIDPDLTYELENSKVEYSSSSNISNEEIVAKYASSDIICFTSVYEGFGMPIVEANITGRVVVTSNLLSMPEVGGNAAHYVDPFSVESIRNGIQKVINEDDYRNQLIFNGFENAKRFDLKEITTQYVSVYKGLIR